MVRRHDDEPPAPRRHSPARTPEERESILINKSMSLIERQVDDGTASSQILTFYGKLGSSRERLEQERMREEILVLRKKVETMESAVDVKNLMTEALQAFKGYTGETEVTDDRDFYD